MGKSVNELYRFRDSLMDKMKVSDLEWNQVVLADGVTLNVSNVLKVDGYYVPVTAKETFAFCRPRGFFPLTRAVLDQIQNKAIFVPYRHQGELADFEKYSVYLNDKKYTGVINCGAHKIWTLTNKRGKKDANNKETKAVNYGFYELRANQAKGADELGGARLSRTYNPTNGLWGGHGDFYWDYSQLLQVMYASAPLTIDGEKMSLAMALAVGKSVVSDEGAFDSEDMP